MKTVVTVGMLLLVALVAAAGASAATVATPVCVADNGCFPGITVTQCAQLAGGTYYTSDQITATIQAECTTGCCQYTDVQGAQQQDQTTKATCDYLGGLSSASSTFQAGQQCKASTNFCQEGQTNCICGGVQITTGTYCCNNIPNSTACAPTSTTTPSATNTCGNHKLDASEQCDPTVQATNCPTIPGQTQSCTNQCDCAISPSDYPSGTNYCDPTNTACTTQSTCIASAPAPTCVSGNCVTSVPGTDKAQVSWGMDQTCSNVLSGFKVLVEGAGAAVEYPITGLLPNTTSSSQFTVTNDTNYNVTVIAVYSDGTQKPSDKWSFTSGDSQCFNGGNSFCSDAATLVTCDANNKASPTDCSKSEEQCYPTTTGTPPTPSAACEPPVVCSACDLGYASMAEYELGLPQNQQATFQLQSGGTTQNLACSQLLTPYSVNGQSVTFCYYGQTFSALKQFRSCSEVSSCSNYLSQSSCTQNACQAPGTCEWNQSVGACTAKETQFQVCDPSMDQATCEAQGNRCVYDGTQCIDRSQASCSSYRTQSACVGTTGSFTIDKADNHNVTVSDDTFGFGKCVWGTPTGSQTAVCYKDANNDGTPELDNDFTDPVTTITTDLTQTFPPNVVIHFLRSEAGTTYASLTSGACGTIQRPTSQSSVDQNAMTMNFATQTSGTQRYCLQYYTEDVHSNLEYVKQSTITVSSDALSFMSVNVTPIAKQNNVSDVNVTFEVNRMATCNASLSNDTTTFWPRHTDSYAQAFALYIHDVPNGAYTFNIQCAAQGTTITNTTALDIDVDNRIAYPFPPMGKYLPGKVSSIGVYTQQPAKCTYNNGTAQVAFTDASQPVPLNSGQYYRHYATPQDQANGYHDYPVTCTFKDGTTLQGSGADTIRYAIDSTPPVAWVQYNQSGQNITLLSGTLPAPNGGRTVDILCKDALITGYGGNWESGCKYLLLSEQGGAFTQHASLTGYQVKPGDHFAYRGVDALGNAGPVQTVDVTSSDISGPERPTLQVVPQ